MDKHIALIGAGNWGKNHLRNLKNLGALHSVLELSTEITELRKSEHPDTIFVSDEREITGNPEIKGVVIAAPAHLHYELAKKYLEAGKDVLVDVHDIDEIVWAESSVVVKLDREQIKTAPEIDS